MQLLCYRTKKETARRGVMDFFLIRKLPTYRPLCPWVANGFRGILSSRFAVR